MRGEGKRKPRAADDPGRLAQRENALKRLANLKPIKPGETRNPEGKNGAKWLGEFKRFFDEAAHGGDATRYHNVCQALYLKAIKGDVNAVRVIVEQMQGKPKEHVDLSNEDGSLRPMSVTFRLVDDARPVTTVESEPVAGALPALEGDGE